MLRKALALTVIFTLLVTWLAAVPAALASDYYSARTPLAGSGKAKINNINLAIEAIDGMIVPYGGSFSFNETVGPRIKTRGYQTAPNGRGALVTGGGVAQVASTLYMALLKVRGDIEIDPVKTYGNRFTDNYVTDVDHAVITDYDADIDLSFTNYADDMTIDLWANDRYVYCSITVGEDGDMVKSDYVSTSAVPDLRSLIDADVTDGEGDDYDDEDDGWFITPIGDDDEPERVLLATACLYSGTDENVLKNVDLAADCVTDTTLNPRDLFSFNDVVGPRTREYGYVRAVNGRGALVTGGGVAQVASVIWLAVKDMDDISIVEKATYGDKYNQTYVNNSSDAILTDYNANRDFSFRYTGRGSISIYTYLSDGWLYCDVYGD